MTTGKTIALTRQTFVGKVMSLLFNMLSRLLITFLSVQFSSVAQSCLDSLEVLKLKVRRGGIWPTRISAPSSVFRATNLQCDNSQEGRPLPPHPRFLNLRKQEGSRLNNFLLYCFLPWTVAHFEYLLKRSFEKYLDGI